MIDEQLKKPLIAIAVPLLAIPAILIILFAVKFVLSGSGSAQAEAADISAKLGRPRLSAVLKSEAAGVVAPGAALSFDGKGNLFVGWGQNIVEARSRRALLAEADPFLSSFVATPEGLLVTVREGSLGYVSAAGVEDRIALPSAGMRLARLSGDRLCVFGQVSEKVWAVYLLEKGGGYAKLFTFPTELSAVAGAPGGLIFASAGGIYRMEFGKRIYPMLYLPAGPPIRSLVFDPGHEAVFFTTPNAVCMLLEGRLVRLVEKVSGTLGLGPDGLYVLSDNGQALIRVDNIFSS